MLGSACQALHALWNPCIPDFPPNVVSLPPRAPNSSDAASFRCGEVTMRAVETAVELPKARKRSRHQARSTPLHRSRLRSLALEPLEARTLMATLPPAVVTRTLDVSNSGGNQSSPSIAIDPVNPN